MPSILIIDKSKASIVMTSEILKDHVNNVHVEVFHTGKECIENIRNKEYDLVIIDFDLPDADGITLAKLLRSYFDGPIFITAFQDDVVEEAIQTEMFAYADICSYLKKPVHSKELLKKFEDFVTKKKSIKKEFKTNFSTEILKTDKTKKTSPVKAKMINLSLSGAGISSKTPLQAKVGEQVSLVLAQPKNSKKTATKLKANVMWMDKTKKKAKFEFTGMSEKSMKDLESLIRNSSEESS